jgi:hypothetical protein
MGARALRNTAAKLAVASACLRSAFSAFLFIGGSFGPEDRLSAQPFSAGQGAATTSKFNSRTDTAAWWSELVK